MKPLLILLLAAVTFSQQSHSQSPASPEEAVRRADQAWLKAITSKSVQDAVDLYDAEAITMGPAMPPAHGPAEIRAMWQKLFAQPNFRVTWKTERIVITDAGKIAAATGTWSGAGETDAGPFLAVWRKQPDGKWKVLIDSAWFSSPPKNQAR
jgi:ketosteroid isomerase-like protein